MCSVGKMDPILLTFKNTDLERAYDRFLDNGGLWCRDKWFFKFFGAVIVLLGYSWTFGGRDELAPSVLWFASAWISIAIVFMTFRLGQGHSAPRWRTPLAVFLRLYVAVGIVVGKRPILWKLHENRAAAILQVIFACYCPQFMLSSLSVRLKFRLHIIEQAISSSIIFLGSGPGFCNYAEASPGYPHLIMMASSIGEWAHGLLNSMSGKFNPSPPRLAAPCLQLVIFLHLVVSYTMVSYFVWMLEKRSRAIFLNSIARQEPWRSQQLPILHPNVRSMMIPHGGCFFLFTAVSWKLLSWAPAFMENHGFSGGIEL